MRFTRRSRLGIVALSAAAMLALASCSGGTDGADEPSPSESASSTALPGEGKPPVTVGSKNFAEQFVLGELYAGALRAKGYTVDVKSNIGATEIIDAAITSSQIDLYPEYTGAILSSLAHDSERPESADAAYDAAKTFQEGRGLTLLEEAPFSNSDTLTVLTSYAEENDLKEIGDLAKLGSAVTVGAAPAFNERPIGMVGLKELYGLNEAQFKPLGIGLAQQALDAGEVQAADIFTTTPILADSKYTVLEDPKGVFGYQTLAPVVRQDVLDAEGEEFATTINEVSALLTFDAIRSLNKAVSVDQLDPADVAKQFLEANGLA